ncbi:MAG: hypothetical protein Q9224_005615, partial [Gallowayella concinna]
MRAINLTQSALLLALVCLIAEVIASRHEAKAKAMGLVDVTTKCSSPSQQALARGSSASLYELTSIAAPETIARSSSLCYSSDPCVWAPANPPPPNPILTPPTGSSPPTAVVGLSSAFVGSTTAHNSITTSVPFLSELMSQLFAHSTQVTELSLSTPSRSLTYAASWPSTARTPVISATTAQSSPTSPAVQADPKDLVPPASAPSMLVYSFTLPPYAGGLDTSGIVETVTQPSLTEGKDKPFSTVYSYSLPPYTPKVPTYVATSARMAPVDMTSGGPGGPDGAGPTNEIFLQKGFVDPSQNLVFPTSPVIPLYSPACLGNAYGGGYVITPTMSVANTNATGVAKIPPAYGFTYKLEPTQSLDYDGAVIIVDTKHPGPTKVPSPDPALSGSSSGSFESAYPQPSGVISGTNLPLKDAPQIPSKDLTPTSTDNTYGMSAPWGSFPNHVFETPPPSGAYAGTPTLATDGTTVIPDNSVLTSIGSVHGTSPSGDMTPVSVSGLNEAFEARTGSSPLTNDITTMIPIIPLPVSTAGVHTSSVPGNMPAVSVSGSFKPFGASTGHTPLANNEPIVNSHKSGSMSVGSLQGTINAGNSAFTPMPSAQPSEGGGDGLPSPTNDAPTTISDDLVPTPHAAFLGTTFLESSLLNPDIVPTVRSSVIATRIRSVVVTTVTTWCPSTAPDHLSIISSILSHGPPSASFPGSRASANGNHEDKIDDTLYAHITPSISLGGVTTSTATVTITG